MSKELKNCSVCNAPKYLIQDICHSCALNVNAMLQGKIEHLESEVKRISSLKIGLHAYENEDKPVFYGTQYNSSGKWIWACDPKQHALALRDIEEKRKIHNYMKWRLVPLLVDFRYGNGETE